MKKCLAVVGSSDKEKAKITNFFCGIVRELVRKELEVSHKHKVLELKCNQLTKLRVSNEKNLNMHNVKSYETENSKDITTIHINDAPSHMFYNKDSVAETAPIEKQRTFDMDQFNFCPDYNKENVNNMANHLIHKKELSVKSHSERQKKNSGFIFKDNIKENINTSNFTNINPQIQKNAIVKTMKKYQESSQPLIKNAYTSGVVNTQKFNGANSPPKFVSKTIAAAGSNKKVSLSVRKKSDSMNKTTETSSMQEKSRFFGNNVTSNAINSGPYYTVTNSYTQENQGQSTQNNQINNFTSNNPHENSIEFSRKESFVTNVSRRYQDFNEDDSTDEDFNNIKDAKKEGISRTNMLQSTTPQKNSFEDNHNELSPISHNNNQSRITIASYLISQDGQASNPNKPNHKTSTNNHEQSKQDYGLASMDRLIDNSKFLSNSNINVKKPYLVSHGNIIDKNVPMFDTNFGILESAICDPEILEIPLPKMCSDEDVEKTVTSKMLYREYK